MESWISKQIDYMVSQFDKSVENAYPEEIGTFRDPVKFFDGLTTKWNYIESVEKIEWGKYLKRGSVMLDLGGGTGWLSAYLSKLENVSEIYLLDSNKHFLNKMLPEINRMMGGNIAKIRPVEGMFQPLFFKDKQLDAVVVSSSLHHADNLADLLQEIRRVLKDDGTLLILNEYLIPYRKYIAMLFRAFLIIIRDNLMMRYKRISPAISSSGYLYDTALNDKHYPLWYWKKVVEASGFNLLETIDTGFPTLKNTKKGLHLVNFVCKKQNV